MQKMQAELSFYIILLLLKVSHYEFCKYIYARWQGRAL